MSRSALEAECYHLCDEAPGIQASIMTAASLSRGLELARREHASALRSAILCRMYPQIAPELRGLWRQERLVITRDRVFTGQGLRQSIEPLNDADAGIIARLVWLLRGHDPSRDTQFQRLEAELLEQREARNLARLKIADWFEQFEVDQRAITQLHWSCKWSECIAMVRLTAERAGHQLSI